MFSKMYPTPKTVAMLYIVAMIKAKVSIVFFVLLFVFMLFVFVSTNMRRNNGFNVNPMLTNCYQIVKRLSAYILYEQACVYYNNFGTYPNVGAYSYSV